MPAKQRIEIEIDEDGSTKIEGHGFIGGLCEKATAFLERALGTIRKRKVKPDHFKREQNRCQTH